jgi:hypothetical protein
VVSSPQQRYFAAELAERLGFFGVQAHVVVHHGADETARLVAALAPDQVIAAGTDARGMAPVVTIRKPADQGTDVYVVPEAGLVAVRPAGEPSYRLLRRYYLLEGEADGRLLLTALLRYHQPLIRFQLPDRGRIVRGRLSLDEVAP